VRILRRDCSGNGDGVEIVPAGSLQSRRRADRVSDRPIGSSRSVVEVTTSFTI